MSLRNFLIVFGAAFSFVANAELELFEPYKDDLFTPELIARGNDCNVSLYNYDEINHVNGQDCAKENGMHKSVAQPNRIGDVSSVRRERLNEIPGLEKTWEIGPQPGGPDGPKCAVVWCHGAVESDNPQHLGARDSNFGANNNRLMNLANQQGCTYYSPSFRGSNGYYAIQSLIDYLRANGVKEIFITASSAGASALNVAANNPANTDILGGLFYTGTYSHPESVERSAAFKAGVPIVFSQGANDEYATARDGYFNVLERNPNANMWLQVFQDGAHGTPIRMIDWRQTLNWARVQNAFRDKNIDPAATSNDSIAQCKTDSSMGIKDYMTDMNNLSSWLSGMASNKGVDCSAFKSGGKYGLPLTRELNRTKGCKPFIVNRSGNVVASINQINCIATQSENRPGSHRYSVQDLPIRQPNQSRGERLMDRPGCHRQAASDYQ